MNLVAYLRSLVERFAGRSRVEVDMDEELRAHIEHRTDDLQRSGLERREAERRARIEFGGSERFKEECREALAGNFFEVLIKDVRFSIRLLRKSPGFTLVAISTLALAIGANAVVFGVLNAIILRPLNVPQADTLYGIEHGNEHSMYESYLDYRDLRDRNRSFEDLVGFNIEMVAIDTGDDPSRVWGVEATGNYFDALGIRPYLGRFFHSSDEHGPNSAPYIVLSHAFWHAHFNDDRTVVGRVVRLNKHPFTIIGVAPPEFRGTLVIFSPDLFVPIVNQEQIEGKYTLANRPSTALFMTLGHLRPGVTPEMAVADLNSIGAYLERTYPKDRGATTFKLARPNLYGNYLGGPMRAFLFGLMVLSGLILLAACANLGGLFAARASDRSREVALRLALGATRNRILRQLLTESVVVSLAGAAFGLWGSVLLLRALAVWQPLPKFPIVVPVSPDATVYIIALGLALVSGLLSGIVPVRQVLQADPYQIVKAASSGITGRRITVRDLLLAGQIAICAVLVTASMVAVRGLARSLHANYGFEPANTVLMDTDLNLAGYRGDKVAEMQKSIIEAVQTIPSVQSVGLAGRLPLAEGGFTSLIFTDGTTDLKVSNAATNAIRYRVSPGYFDAARTALLAGRPFSWHDSKGSPPVAVINRQFARKLFGSPVDAIGRHFKMRDGARIEVVGVVEDGKYTNLTEDPQTALFQPILQTTWSETWLVVRSPRDPEQIAGDIRAIMRRLDPGLPLYLQTWNKQLDSALFPSRMATISLGVLGIMGAMLSVTGIFGMAAYSVSKRLKELGIRIAVGAQPLEVLQAALGRAFKLLVIGSAAGLILGMLSTRVLASIVYQATPRDPVVLGAVLVAMLSLGLLATWIPARRALSVDPLTLLREE